MLLFVFRSDGEERNSCSEALLQIWILVKRKRFIINHCSDLHFKCENDSCNRAVTYLYDVHRVEIRDLQKSYQKDHDNPHGYSQGKANTSLLWISILCRKVNATWISSSHISIHTPAPTHTLSFVHSNAQYIYVYAITLDSQYHCFVSLSYVMKLTNVLLFLHP